MNFDITDFNRYNFQGAIITKCQNQCGHSFLSGEFSEEETEKNGCRYFDLQFTSAEPELPEVNNARIISFQIEERDDEKDGYSVRIHVEDKTAAYIEFYCKDIRFHRQSYKRMSYRNMYGTKEYTALIASQSYVLDKKYFREKEQLALPDNFSIEMERYADVKDMGNYSVNRAALQKCTLKKAGHVVYEYVCTYYYHRLFAEFIYHSNGHRYYPFHIDLYGISYMDVDTAEVYHYVPEGYQHDCDMLLGESFIITDIHYDSDSNLIAYGGCFWAGPSDVMVGDFSNPLDFSPQWVGMQELLDADYEKYEELDFDRWSKEGLWLLSGKVSVLVEMGDIFACLRDKASTEC